MINALVIPFFAMSFGALAGLLIGSLLAIGRLSRTTDQLAIAVDCLVTVAAKNTSRTIATLIDDAMARIKEAGE